MYKTTHNQSYVNHFILGCKGCVLVVSLLLFLTGIAQAGIATAQYHYCSWNRFTLQLPISKYWSTDAEFQARWQSSVNSKNMFDEQLLLSYRHWIYYKPNDVLRFSISPFAYFSANPYIMAPGDEKLNTVGEIRTTIAAEIQEKLLPKFWINGKVGAEYRMYNYIDDIWRTRYRLGGRYDINQKYSVTGNIELLFTAHSSNVFSQLDNERIWATIGRNVTKKLKAEIGLMHLRRNMIKNNLLVKEGDMLVSISYSITDKK